MAGTDFFVERSTGRPRSKCKHCMTKDAQSWNRRNPERHRAIYQRNNLASNLRRRFGISVEQYEELLGGSDGRCGICGRAESRDRRISLDHDHETGDLRGFLCWRCNVLLGHIGDDPELLERAAAYLRFPPLRSVVQRG